MSKRERPRTQKRAATRALDKLTQKRERLFLLEEGGTKERPIEVSSPAVVELKAAALECPRCAVPFHVEAHRAPTLDGVRLREAEVRCNRCGVRRSVWFRLVEPALN